MSSSNIGAIKKLLMSLFFVSALCYYLFLGILIGHTFLIDKPTANKVVVYIAW